MDKPSAAPGSAAAAQDARDVAGKLKQAQQNLRRAVRKPPTHQGTEWAETVSDELAALRDALERHRDEVRGPHCRYEQLCLERQWLIPRIQRLVVRFDDIETEQALLRQQIDEVRQGSGQLAGVARQQATHLLANLHHTLAEEGLLEMERYNEEPPALD